MLSPGAFRGLRQPPVRKGQVSFLGWPAVNPTFKKTRSMQLPREIIAGHDVLPQIAQMTRDFGLKGTGVLVWGPQTRALAGDKIAQTLSDAGYDLQTLEAGDATAEAVSEVKEIASECKATFLVGIGGGTKIDIAKLGASDLSIPFISVPTNCAHDGIASPRATIKVEGRIKSFDARVPLGVLADTAVLIKAPWRFLAAGCADVISNKTAILDWRLAHRLRNEEFSSSAATMSEMSAEAIIGEAEFLKRNLEESAWLIVRPIIVSGVSMAIAEDVEKLSAICVVCGDLACRNQRLVDGKPARYDSPTIQVGGSEAYEARCRRCHRVPKENEDQTALL